MGVRANGPHGDVGDAATTKMSSAGKAPVNLLDCEYTRVGRLPAVTDNQPAGATGRMIRDVLIYTAARLLLVVALTAAI